jgi:CspA family cold shock protein
MAEGTVSWFNSEEGRGAIRPDGGCADLRVDYWEIQMSGYKTLEAGQRVAFATVSDVDTPRAVRVTPLTPDGGGFVRSSPASTPTSRQELPLSPWFYLVFALLLVLAVVFTAVVLLAGWSLPGWVWLGLGLLLVAAFLLARFHT